MNQPPAAAGPDVQQLQQAALTDAAFPGGKHQAFRVFYTAEIHSRIWQHGRENTGVEICGVLVGTWGKDATGPFVAVSEAIRGDAAENKFAEVTFTHATWARINAEMDSRFAHLSIVGWYHTHPDFGIFLSERDVFIHQHFFANPGQVAFVVDPVRQLEGTFCWREGKPALVPFSWVGDRIAVGGEAAPGAAGAGRSPPAERGAPAEAPARAAPPPSEPLSLSTHLLAYLALFLAGYLLANRFAAGDQLRMDQQTARTALFLGVKVGLRENLERLQADLASLTKEAAALGKEHQAAAELTDEQKARWADFRAGLAKVDLGLQLARKDYCLTARETDEYLQTAAAFITASDPTLTRQQRAKVEAEVQQALRRGLLKNFPELTGAPEAKTPNDKDATGAGRDKGGPPNK